MEGLVSLVLFAGFFYLMMRFGCGSHIAHGHHGHGKKQNSIDAIDPVCGKTVPREGGYGKLQDGKLYRFCSTTCLNKFDKNPERYMSKKSNGGELKTGESNES
jgi:YHS domain-containing protein